MDNLPLPQYENHGFSSCISGLFGFWKKIIRISKNLNPKIVSIIVIVFIIVFIYFFYIFSPPSNFPVGMVLRLQKGETLQSISLDLSEDHLIRSRIAFKAFVILYGGEYHIKEGNYLFDGKESVFEIGRRIATGDRHMVPIKITIPEGMNNEQIANIFTTKLPDFNKEKFLAEAENKQGYLFPDTYFFFSGDNQDDVINQLENNFNHYINPLMQEINGSGMTENKILTLASILEKESAVNDDRSMIAGILLKRISLGILLEADAAPITYKEKGLPAEPICNPGLEAIEDALHPKSSPYLFYLYSKDGKIHYATTFAEHEANIKKYLIN